MIKSNNNISYNIDNYKCRQCINSNFCKHINRNLFINQCLPFYNLFQSKINILNFDQTSYIYYDKTNKYIGYIDYNFIIHKISKPIPKQILTNKKYFIEKITYKINKFNIPIFFLFSDYNTIFNIFICKYNYLIAENKKKIIINTEKINKYKQNIKEYYLKDPQIIYLKNKLTILTEKNNELKQNNKLKQNDIAIKNNIKIINNIKEKIKIISNSEDALTIQSIIDILELEIKELEFFSLPITDIFRLDNNTKFISMSYKFNIFNISLLCENYFEIIKLFCSNIEINETTIFNLFKNFNLSAIYYLINTYKHKLESKNINENFLTSEYKKKFSYTSDIKNITDYNAIINIEKNMNNLNNINKDNQDITINIYRKLLHEILIIRYILKNINIPNFSELFFMAIISYRYKNILLNNTWGLNTTYIFKFLKNHLKPTFNNELKSIQNTKYLQMFPIENPIIYEYDKIFYKQTYYGNCMENVILQFLKVIFWNNDTEQYNFDLIKNIIKPTLIQQLEYFFINIKYEKTHKYLVKWVEFITELPHNTNLTVESDLTVEPKLIVESDLTVNNSLKYNFLNKIKEIEINPTFNNLIIALRLLTIYEKKFINDNISFIKLLLNNINNSYTINVKTTNIKINNIINITDIIELNAHNSYLIKLEHNTHAFFDKINNTKYLEFIIFNPDDKEMNSLNDILIHDYNYASKYSNLNAFILYSFADTNDKINNFYYNYIINYIETDKLLKFIDDLFDNYTKLSLQIKINIESNISFIKLLILISPDTYKKCINVCTDTIWKTIDDNDLYEDCDIYLLIKLKIYNKIITDEKFSDILQDKLLRKENFNDDKWIDLFNNYNKYYTFTNIIIDYNIIDYLNDDLCSYIELYDYFNIFDKSIHEDILNQKNINIIDWDIFFDHHDNIHTIYIDFFLQNNKFISWDINNWIMMFNKSQIIDNDYLILFIDEISKYSKCVDIINILISQNIDGLFNNNICNAVGIFLNLNIYEINEHFWNYYIDKILETLNNIDFNKQHFIKIYKNSKYYKENIQINNKNLNDIILQVLI